MAIIDLKNKLYQSEKDKTDLLKEENQFDPRLASEESTVSNESGEWKETKRSLTEKQKKGLRVGAIVLAGILFVASLAVGIYYFRSSSFNEKRVVVSLEGARESRSGKLVSYTIKYNNDNRASLKESVIKVTFPENFKPEPMEGFISESPTTGRFELGEIKKYSQGEINFKGRIYSPEGALIYLGAELSYIPSNFNSRFVSQNQLGINISSSPIKLEVNAPTSISSGDLVSYIITYQNNSAEKFENLRIRADYSEGFTFSKADPVSFESNNVWFIPEILPQSEGKITVSGKLTGNRDEIKTTKFTVGVISEGEFVSYDDEVVETRIMSSSLIISQLVNGKSELTATSGDILRFEISYKNEGSVGLKDIIVTEKLDGEVLDLRTLELNRGSYDADSKKIIWKAVDYKELSILEPGQGGKINFSVRVKKPISFKEGEKNLVISTLAQIDSPDIPTPINMNKLIAGNSVDIKIDTQIKIEAKGSYKDSVIENSGPVPPMVNRETTYTIHWVLTNGSNDVKNARVEASLPTGVIMTDKIYPSNLNLKYNSRTNMIVWEIGEISSGTGVYSNPKEAVFQVKIKPTINQLDQIVDLLRESKFTALDSFTGNEVSSSALSITTYLRDDSVAYLKDRVQPESN